ncbi:unnamed protein product [Paramecium pentaurelia]|uniref:Uncharacterized protein n=1 Tax=Paramecium pentaurelia TaxID=43138 RepID=A0A8S1T1Q7_9CILI|nr:unnamed protein product [Paramecium pentaurelia]
MNKVDIIKKFSLEYSDEFLKRIEHQSLQQIIKLIFESPLAKITKPIDLKNLKQLNKPTLFEISAVQNISEPKKTRYMNTKDCTLQFIFYPNIVAISLQKHPELDQDLFQLEGKKILIPQGTEICRSILILKQFTLINDYNQLL